MLEKFLKSLGFGVLAGAIGGAIAFLLNSGNFAEFGAFAGVAAMLAGVVVVYLKKLLEKLGFPQE